MMKKLILITFAVFMTTLAYSRGWDRSTEIKAKELPSTSQKIISNHFNGLSNVDSARKWPDNYGVYLKSGQKLNFYLDGSLKDAKADNSPIPQEVLSVLPKKVASYIKSKYSDWDLIEVEVKSSKIEIELEKGKLDAKLKFSSSGELLKEKIDD